MDKRKLIAILALGGSIAIGSLFMGGDEPIHGSYRGGYYSQAGSYRGGGGAAELDTVIMVFAINVDTTSITHSHSEFNYWVGQAGAANCIDLSDPANEFAFCIIDSSTPYSTINIIDSNAWYRTSAAAVSGGAGYAGRWIINDPNRRFELVYIPYEKFIPAGIEIVWAEYKRGMLANGSFANTDSLCATLMTIPGDSLWHKEVGVTAPGAGALTRYANASYRWQQAGLNTEGYPASDVGPWEPEWKVREQFWDIGDYSDWTGAPSSALPWVNYDEWDQDITDCVQAVANGAVNNGICTIYMDSGTSITQDFATWQGAAGAANQFAYVVVKYITKPYVAPWPNGLDFAISIQTDDARRNVNEDFAAAMRTHNGKFSMLIPGGLYGAAGTPTWSYAESVLAWFDEGIIDVVCHGTQHIALESFGDSMVVGEYTRGMYPDTLSVNATQWDRTLYELDPEWIFQWAESLGRSELRTDPNWGKAQSQAAGGYGAAAQKAIDYHGFIGYRVVNVDKVSYDPDGNIDSRHLADLNPASADTAYQITRPHRANALLPRNLVLLPNSHSTADILGSKSDFFSETHIKLITKSLIENVRAQNRGVFSVFTHDVKTNEDSSAYTHGVDPDEIDWMCDVFDEYGNPYITFTEKARWLHQWATPVATPAGYAQPDSFKFTANDNVWFVPDGMDNRFIRGLR